MRFLLPHFAYQNCLKVFCYSVVAAIPLLKELLTSIRKWTVLLDILPSQHIQNSIKHYFKTIGLIHDQNM